MLLTQATLALAYASALFMAGQRAAYEPPLHIAEQLFRDEGNRHGLGPGVCVTGERGSPERRCRAGNRMWQPGVTALT